MLTKEKILEVIAKKGRVKTGDFVDEYGVSRQYASKLLRGLADDNLIVKIGSTRSAFYVSEEYIEKHPEVIPMRYSRELQNSGLEEHKVFTDIEEHFAPLSKLPENIKSIFEYAFSEMLNNAIEHSESGKITFTVGLDKEVAYFIVDDGGVGVFNNIKEKRKLAGVMEAIQDLLKGKTTTAPKLHSGEGIFFTSKVGDEFVLESYGHQLRIDNIIKDVFIRTVPGQKQGTRVVFRVNTHSTHHLNDIFKEYADVGADSDYGFDKTEIRVRLYAVGGVNISRSQARRVLAGLDTFKIIIMDYDRVPTVGQAFADEIYRVFHNKRPDIEIQNVHMNETVAFMVERAIHEASKEK